MSVIFVNHVPLGPSTSGVIRPKHDNDNGYDEEDRYGHDDEREPPGCMRTISLS